METGDVLIARANFHVRYPARFQLIAAMNPCKCGYGSQSGRACGRGLNCESRYQSRISGPLFDRMDIHLELPPVTAAELSRAPDGEPSATIADRVAKAREAQRHRGGQTNAALADDALMVAAKPDSAGGGLLSQATEQLHFSARGYTRILRVARTLADLDGGNGVQRRHIAEAISYRKRENSAQNFTKTSLAC